MGTFKHENFETNCEKRSQQESLLSTSF